RSTRRTPGRQIKSFQHEAHGAHEKGGTEDKPLQMEGGPSPRASGCPQGWRHRAPAPTGAFAFLRVLCVLRVEGFSPQVLSVRSVSSALALAVPPPDSFRFDKSPAPRLAPPP